MSRSLHEHGIPSSLLTYATDVDNKCLILLTHVLNASNSWLVLRYLNSLLHNDNGQLSRQYLSGENNTDNRTVIFVSYLRSWDFWHDGARRLGRDLSKDQRLGKLRYMDGLGGLFLGPETAKFQSKRDQEYDSLAAQSAEALERHLLSEVNAARTARPGKPVTVIIDGLDFLVACRHADANALIDTISAIRSAADGLLLSMAADSQLTQTSTTPIEQDHRTLLVSVAHQASFVISTRLLTTGAARDVSGVLRATRGTENIDENELLYLVNGDGSVKVFERGS